MAVSARRIREEFVDARVQRSRVLLDEQRKIRHDGGRSTRGSLGRRGWGANRRSKRKLVRDASAGKCRGTRNGYRYARAWVPGDVRGRRKSRYVVVGSREEERGLPGGALIIARVGVQGEGIGITTWRRGGERSIETPAWRGRCGRGIGGGAAPMVAEATGSAWGG